MKENMPYAKISLYRFASQGTGELLVTLVAVKGRTIRKPMGDRRRSEKYIFAQGKIKWKKKNHADRVTPMNSGCPKSSFL